MMTADISLNCLGDDIINDVETAQPKEDYSNTSEGVIDSNSGPDILYKIDDVPPWHLSLVLGFQHYLTMFAGAISIPYIITTQLCMEEDSTSRGFVISTTIFVSGIATFLQATFGSRLPIIQGPSLAFLVPTLAILSQSEWRCPDPQSLVNATMAEKDEIWMSRMREVQGAIIVASVVEVLVGLTGLMGFLMRWITPLAIVPTVTLIGLNLFETAAEQASDHWGIAVLTIFLLILFSQYLGGTKVPFPAFTRSTGCYIQWIPIFKTLPVLLSVIISWGLCVILTVTNVFPPGSGARTDVRLKALYESDWIKIPYPGQYGMPTISIGPVLGIVAGVMASAVESIGDYYACARLVGAPPPPIHAVNRGIWMEGIGCVLAGCFGTGSGLTSYSQNIGAIGITKVGSRRVVQIAAVFILLFGIFGKFGALFIAIPPPIIGAIFIVTFGIVTGVGLSSLQFVNLNSSRNLFIIGFSIFMGLCVPGWLAAHPDAIDTGSDVVNQIAEVLLKTSMFVGGFFGCFLDNTIPGSRDERGLTKWNAEVSSSEYSDSTMKCYDLPYITDIIKDIKFFRYLPLSPTYDGTIFCARCRKQKSSKKVDQNHYQSRL